MLDTLFNLAKSLFRRDPDEDINLPPEHPIFRADRLMRARTIDYDALAVVGQEAVELLRADPNDARDGAIALAKIAEVLAKKDAHKGLATVMAVDALCNSMEIEKPIPARILTDILETMRVGNERTLLAQVVAGQIVVLEARRLKPTKLMRRALVLIQEEVTAQDTPPERRFALHAIVALHASHPVQIKEAAEGVMAYSKYAPSHAVTINTLGVLRQKTVKYPLLRGRIEKAMLKAADDSRPLIGASRAMAARIDV